MWKATLILLLAWPVSASVVQKRWMTETERVEQSQHIPAGLLKALISIESSYNPNAVNAVGPGTAIASYGIAQLTTESLDTCNIKFNDRFDGHQGLRCAARLLRGLLSKYHSVEAAISGYNDGTPCRCHKRVWVTPLGKECPLPRHYCGVYTEGNWRNQNYVDLVLNHMR